MIKNIGVNDHLVDLFEGQYEVKNGMRYNSYLVIGEKIAVMDTVDKKFTEEWLGNIVEALGDREPDYVVVLHMEPDHSASLEAFLNKYPNATLVTNNKAIKMVNQFFPNLVINNYLEVKENDVLDLGGETLKFITAPMVHWPEVMVAYDANSKALFSADAFGKFGATDIEDEWVDEARRYYIGIVGKYGSFVQKLFPKLAGLEIEKIYSLHGPVVEGDLLPVALDLYTKWSSYTPEVNGTLIAYASIYGNTKKAAEALLEELGDENACIMDLARVDIHEAIANAFKYSKLVIASPTYNTELFPVVREFIHGLTERNYTNRLVGIIDNGTWGPMIKKCILKEFEGSKDIRFTETTVVIKSAMNKANAEEIKALAKELKEN